MFKKCLTHEELGKRELQCYITTCFYLQGFRFDDHYQLGFISTVGRNLLGRINVNPTCVPPFSVLQMFVFSMIVMQPLSTGL